MQKLELINKVITAPLAGVSDKPFRKMLANFTPGLIFSEMLSAEAIIRNNQKTFKMAIDSNDYKYSAAQVFGSRPEQIRDAILILKDYFQPYSFDINMGCPVRKIVKDGAGAALMLDEKKIEKIVNAAVKVCDRLTIKIRAGWSKTNLNYLKIAKIAEFYALSAITIHPRTAVQLYSGKADWTIVAELKNKISIPVIGNGDILTLSDFQEKIKLCDYCMIGRGILYNPFLLKEINENKNYAVSIEELKNFMLKHLKELSNFYGALRAIKIFRKFFAWYIKSKRNASSLREQAFKINDYHQFEEFIINLNY